MGCQEFFLDILRGVHLVGAARQRASRLPKSLSQAANSERAYLFSLPHSDESWASITPPAQAGSGPVGEALASAFARVNCYQKNEFRTCCYRPLNPESRRLNRALRFQQCVLFEFSPQVLQFILKLARGSGGAGKCADDVRSQKYNQFGFRSVVGSASKQRAEPRNVAQ